MAEMTPRERIVAALDHREPDRLPMDFGGRNSTIHVFAQRDLKRYLGLEGGEEKIRDYFTYVADPDPRLLERFGRDCTPVRPKAGSNWELHIDPSTNTWVDEWGTKYYMPSDGYYYDIWEVPLAGAETIADLDSYRFPDPRDPARMRGVVETIDEAHRAGKAAMMLSGQAGLWTTPWFLRGFEGSYADLACNLKLVEELAERITQWHIAYWETVLAQVGDRVELVQVEGDIGSTEGPLFSPEIFRRIYKPRFARWISAIKALTRAKVWIHCCGSAYWAIPDFIECGIDAINPVQVNARDMDSARLKREFGKELTFWGGGCNPVVLQLGSVQEVEDEVRRRIDDFAPGGGFVFASVQNIQPNVPPENIVAMYETAHRCGGY